MGGGFEIIPGGFDRITPHLSAPQGGHHPAALRSISRAMPCRSFRPAFGGALSRNKHGLDWLAA